MEMMNRAIEDAADFRGMMDKITTDRNRLLLQPAEDGTPNERRFLVLPDRHAQELLAQDITLQNMAERHAQELRAYELTVQNLRDERDAAMKDAERYRWLRDVWMDYKPAGYDGRNVGRFDLVLDYPVDDLDAAIDAAIAKAEGRKK